ncbi:MAG: molybdopterin cofactor-binding domain-containing protein, partial [Betaproteobacteria bacterium]
MAIAFTLPLGSRIAQAQVATGPGNEQLASAYVVIGSDGSITLNFGGAEMGQGSMSGLAQLLAEELMVDWNQITIRQSPVDPIVSYLTGGSSAIAGRYTKLRTAGAAARELLIAAAMQLQATQDTNRDHYAAASAVVTHLPSNASWPYAVLARPASNLTAPADLRLTDPANFRLIGKAVPRIDIPSKVDGSAQYGIDKWLPNMVFAAIKHCPTLGGTLASPPSKPSGAIAVIPCSAVDSRGKVVAGTVNAVAVVSTDTWQAMRMARSLSVSWKLPASTGDVDSTQLATQSSTLMANGAALVAEPTPPSGYTPASFAAVIEPAVKSALGTPTRERTFTLPFLAHGTMEPLNCTVVPTVSGGTVQALDIYAPTQGASWVVGYAQALSGLAAAKINVHTMLLGGGLGRKFEMDFVGQAIQVAMSVKRPVKLTWSREEDFTHDQYRPCALVN